MGRTLTRLQLILLSRAATTIALAVGLAISAIALLVPQGPRETEAVRAWAAAHPVLEAFAASAGMHNVLSSAVFWIALTGILAITIAHALAATRIAARLQRGVSGLTALEALRLRERPNLVIALAPDADGSAALSGLSGALDREGYRVRRGSRLIQGAGSRWTDATHWLLPMLMWALVALLLVVAVGRATRHEGTMALPMGQVVREAPQSYRDALGGPFFRGRYTGLELRADEMVVGSDESPVLRISVLRKGVGVATAWVDSETPLRYGPLTVRLNDTGIASTYSVESSSGAQVGSLPFLLRIDDSESTMTVPAGYALSYESGQPMLQLRVRMSVDTDADGRPVTEVPPSPLSVIETAAPGAGSYGDPVSYSLGGSFELPDGQWLRYVAADNWGLVTVVNDWSSPYVLGLVALAALLVTAVLVVRPRLILVGLTDVGGGSALNVVTHGLLKRSTARRLLLAALPAESVDWSMQLGDDLRRGEHDNVD